MRGILGVTLGVLLLGASLSLYADESPAVQPMYSREYLEAKLPGNAEAAIRKSEGASWLLEIRAFAEQAKTLDDDSWTAAIQLWTARKHQLLSAGGYSGFVLGIRIHEVIGAELCRRAVNEHRNVVALAQAHMLQTPLCWHYIKAMQSEGLLSNLDESLLPQGDVEMANRILMGMILKRQHPEIYGKKNVPAPAAVSEEVLFDMRGSAPMTYSAIREAIMREDMTLLVAQMYSQPEVPETELLPDEQAVAARLQARGKDARKAVIATKDEDYARRFRWAVRELYPQAFLGVAATNAITQLRLNRKRVRGLEQVKASKTATPATP